MPEVSVPTSSIKEQKHDRGITLFVLAVYGLLAVIVTWPVITRVGTELAGSHSDLWIHQWTFWWVKQALLNGADPFYTTLLYFPNGVSLTSHNIAWFNIAMWLPLQAVIGNVAAYNLVFIAVYALNGFAFYLFAYELTKRRIAAFLGGLVFCLWPYTLSHNDHPNMVVLFWVPLALLFLQRTYMEKKLRYGLFLAVAVAMIGITRWQLLVMSGPILAAYGLFLFLRVKNEDLRRTVILLLLAGSLAILLMVPLATPVVIDQLARDDTADVMVEEKEGVTDLLAYVIPPALYNYFWRDAPFPSWFLEPYENIAASVHYVPFIGYLTLILAIYGAIKKWRQSWFWSLLAAAIILFALGSTFTFNGQKFPLLPMPYRLLGDSIVATLVRRPHRLNLFLSIPVAMLVSWAMVDLQERIRRSKQQNKAVVGTLTAVAAALIIFLENPIAPPFPTTPTEIPRWYQQLAAEAGEFGILELPTYDRGFDKIYMFYQIQHGKAISGGHVSRLPAEANAFRESISFLRPMLRQESWLVQLEDWVNFNDVDITRQFRQLAKADIRYIVINKPLLTDGALERWIDWVTLKPIYEDETVLVYRSEPEAGKDFAISTNLSESIGLIRATYQPSEANQEGTVKLDLRWGSSAEPYEAYRVCFLLRDAQKAHVQEQCTEIAAGWPTTDWKANEVVRGTYTVPIPAELPAGNYSLDLFLATDDQQRFGDIVTLGDVTVHPFRPAHRTQVCWDGKICLQGYDLQYDQQTLNLTAFWLAPRALDMSHKVFVHLMDRATGEVVAQSDTIPREWRYPTDIWEPGEIVRDTVTLDLGDIGPGEYAIMLGWYQVDGGERLRACPTGDCEQETADAFELTTIVVPEGKN